MRMPEVVAPDQDVLPENEWENVKTVIVDAANQLMEHRREEGEAMLKGYKAAHKQYRKAT